MMTQIPEFADEGRHTEVPVGVRGAEILPRDCAPVILHASPSLLWPTVVFAEQLEWSMARCTHLMTLASQRHPAHMMT